LIEMSRRSIEGPAIQTVLSLRRYRSDLSLIVAGFGDSFHTRARVERSSMCATIVTDWPDVMLSPDTYSRPEKILVFDGPSCAGSRQSEIGQAVPVHGAKSQPLK
jgi:hypothetical protein